MVGRIRRGVQRNTGLCDAINGVLAALTADDYKDMMNEAIAVQPLTQD